MMTLKEQIQMILIEKNKRLLPEAVQLIKNMDNESLSLLAEGSELELEAKLLLHIKRFIDKCKQCNPELSEEYDEYYIAISKDKFETPIALIFPIGRFICYGDAIPYRSIKAIGMDYDLNKYVANRASADLHSDFPNIHLSSFDVYHPLNQKGIGGFIFSHLAPAVKSINAFLDKFYLKENAEMPKLLRDNLSPDLRYKTITARVAADESRIPQDKLKKFYSKYGYHLTDDKGFKTKNNRYRKYLLKEI